MPSSKPSLTCRIDWTPSRGLAACVWGLAGLACLAFWASAMPAWAALAASCAAGVHALVVVRRLGAARAMSVQLANGGGEAGLNFPGGSQSLTGATLRFRGPLASLAGRDPAGRTRRLLWWPDTLPSAARRQLHLVAGHSPAESPSSLPPGY